MTPDHKFELIRTVISIIPATVLSAWAFIHQRRQTAPRLKVIVSPVFWSGVAGEQWLADDWPGIVVLNESTFPLRVSSVGYKIGKKYYEFGRPITGNLKPPTTWPMEIAPRSRISLYLNPHTIEGRAVMDAVSPALQGRTIWKAGRAYAMTECSHTFISRRLKKSSVEMLSKARKAQEPQVLNAIPPKVKEQIDKAKPFRPAERPAVTESFGSERD
jgi:hypothetical protein